MAVFNDAGEVVGYAHTASGDVHAVRWDPQSGSHTIWAESGARMPAPTG
jgi:probable HAF family extracellular repeat protein